MAIILEGNDSSGKSFLADRIGMPVYRSGGPPRNHNHMLECLRDQLMAVEDNYVLDRVTCISQQIYNEPKDVHADYLLKILSTPGTVLVHCRPSDLNYALTKHEVKAYDTVEHLEKVVSNYHNISQAYDRFMSKVPHITYDWQSQDLDNGNFIKQLRSWTDPANWLDYFKLANLGSRNGRDPLIGTLVDGKYQVVSILETDDRYCLVQLSDKSFVAMKYEDLQ
jgi:hypothetical protein